MRFFLVLSLIAFANVSHASCQFYLDPQHQDDLANAPETAMDYQDVEIELNDGTRCRVSVSGCRYLTYNGPNSFSPHDIKEIVHVFDRAGNKIYP